MNATRHANAPTRCLSVSVVVYRPDAQRLAQTLRSLASAYARLKSIWPDFEIDIWLVDNGGLADATEAARSVHGVTWSVISGQGNVGYGRGHNLAIAQAHSTYHLILNPDIDIEPDALVRAVEFLDGHQEAGLVAPHVGDGRGHAQHLCRRYPTLFDLFVRGFMPAQVRQIFRRRLAHYEMQDLIDESTVVWDPPIVSGCFMFFRTSVLKRLGGFDERYFLYFEDYDLSLRTHDVANVVYLPTVRVLHHGGGAARKGGAHIRMFVVSACKFFNRFGWKWV
jgi:GT2 family glycosyltransferase